MLHVSHKADLASELGAVDAEEARPLMGLRFELWAWLIDESLSVTMTTSSSGGPWFFLRTTFLRLAASGEASDIPGGT